MATMARERSPEGLYETYEEAVSTAAIGPPRNSNGTKTPRGRVVWISPGPVGARPDETVVQDSNNARSIKSKMSTPPRSAMDAGSTPATPDLLDSEGSHLPRVRKPTSPKSSDSSRSNSSSNLSEMQRRADDILLLRKQLMKHSIGAPADGQQRPEAERKAALNPFTDNSSSSWANSLREPPALGRRRNSAPSLRHGRSKELPSGKRRSSTTSSEDESNKPVRKNADRITSRSRTPRYASLAASHSGAAPQKPADDGAADGPPVDAVKNHGRESSAIQKLKRLRNSPSAPKMVLDHTKSSNGTREPSPAPTRQRIRPDSQARSASTTVMPTGAKRPTNVDSNEENAEVDRASGARLHRESPAGRSDSKPDGTRPSNSQQARSGRTDGTWDKKSADATTRTQRGHGSSDGNLKREDERPADETHKPPHKRLPSPGANLKRDHDIAAGRPGRGLSQSFRHGGEADSGAGSRRRSSSRGKNSDLRHDDDERPVNTHKTHRRHSSTGGNLKLEQEIAAYLASRGLGRSSRHEGAAGSAAGSRRWTSSRSKDNNFKREDDGKTGPADAHIYSKNRSLVHNNGSLKNEHASAPDHLGRSLRRERESDLIASSRRTSSSRYKNLEGNFPVTRQGSSRSLKVESRAQHANMNGSQMPHGGNLKQENGANSAAGSRDTTNRTFRKQDVSKRGASALQKHRSTERKRVMALTKVAAASFNGGSLPFDGMMPFPEDSAGLNKFLDGCKREVEEEARVLERNLTVVLGKENSDLDSMVSAIAYAYFLHCTTNQDIQYVLPVINVRQEHFIEKHEAAWLFKVCGIDTSNLIFVDQINLPYYKSFGRLSIVLVDHSKLSPYQEEDLQDAVVKIIDHNLPESVYPGVLNLEIAEVGSCATLIAEKYSTEAPELLAGRGISRLLLGPILLDTTNVDARFATCTIRDECMVALLINGAGCFGRQGFFRHLRNLRFDVSHLSTKDALTQEFVEWNLGPDTARPISAAMSTLGVPLVVMFRRKDIMADLRQFGSANDFDFHLIVTGYFDDSDRYHREILVVAEDSKLAQQISICFSEHADKFKLSSLRIDGLPAQMLVYKQLQVMASRRMLRKILSTHFAR